MDDKERAIEARREGLAYVLPSEVERVERQQATFSERVESRAALDIEYKGRQVAQTWLLIFLSALGLFATSYQAYLAERATSAAESASNTAATALADSQQAFAKTMAQMELQSAATTAAADAATAANQIATRALVHGVEATRLQQRAWVGPLSIDMEPWKVGEPFRLAVVIKNSGLTPAFNVRIRGRWALRDPAWEFVPDFKDSNDQRWGVLQPTQTAKLPLNVPVTPTTVTDVKQGRQVLWFWGRITYEDASRRQPHPWTQYCFRLQPDSSVSPCANAYTDAR